LPETHLEDYQVMQEDIVSILLNFLVIKRSITQNSIHNLW